MRSNPELNAVACLAASKGKHRPNLPVSFHQQDRVAIRTSRYRDHKARFLPYTLGETKIDRTWAPAIHHEGRRRTISRCDYNLRQGWRSAQLKVCVSSIYSGYGVCVHVQ